MASSSSSAHVSHLTLLILVGLISLLSPSASARPCKTLFIQTFSISTIPRNPYAELPSFPRHITVFTEISQFHNNDNNNPNTLFLRFPFEQHQIHQHERQEPQEEAEQQQALPFWFASSSLRDRTKDILSVVVALLFGVGCGALTAATMYLAWSLFSSSSSSSRSPYDPYFDGDSSDDDDLPASSPKKMGYVKIQDDESKPLKQEKA